MLGVKAEGGYGQSGVERRLLQVNTLQLCREIGLIWLGLLSQVHCECQLHLKTHFSAAYLGEIAHLE